MKIPQKCQNLLRGLSDCNYRRKTHFRKGNSRATLLFASRSTLFLGISGSLELKRELLFEEVSLDLCQCQDQETFQGTFSKGGLFLFLLCWSFFLFQNVFTKYLVINLVAPMTILLVISSHLMWTIFSTFSTLLFRMSPL